MQFNSFYILFSVNCIHKPSKNHQLSLFFCLLLMHLRAMIMVVGGMDGWLHLIGIIFMIMIIIKIIIIIFINIIPIIYLSKIIIIFFFRNEVVFSTYEYGKGKGALLCVLFWAAIYKNEVCLMTEVSPPLLPSPSPFSPSFLSLF